MIKLLKKYIKNCTPAFVGSVFFVIMQVFVQTVLLMAEMKTILDQGVVQSNMDVIRQSGFKMLFYTLLCGTCSVVGSYLSARVTAKITCDIRKDCFRKVSEMSPQDFNRFGASTLLTRTMADGMQIQILMINILRSSLMVPVIIVCLLILLYQINRQMFWLIFAFFAATVFYLVYFGIKSKPAFVELQNKTDTINLFMREKLSGARAIRAFRNQGFEEEKMAAANQAAYESAVRANAKINFLAPVSCIAMNWAVVITYLLGTRQLQMKMTSISDLLLLFQYLAFLIASLDIVPVLVNMLPKASVSSQRINELLEYESVTAPNRNNMQTGIGAGRVEFENVIFGYSGATNVIADISFVAKPGKVTAFIGATGSGKTTIMNLLMGLYQMTFGEIKIDGISIRDFNSDYLRSRISFATQRAMVFQDTVFHNISAYDEAVTSQDVLSACDDAGFTEVLNKMPDGLNTIMAQGGMNISGGQRQRLSLARAIAKDADIYIFDDTFSALDAKTEAAVRGKIKERLKGKTVFMVAQKISTIADADHIIVLEKGRIAGQGTHDELMASCREYQEIYKTQCYMEEESL